MTTAAKKTGINVITHLSFSRLKNLDHSPLALYEYIHKEKKKTPAMLEGSLLDCYLFTPEAFDEQFYIIPPGLVKPSKSQINAKNPSTESVRQILAWEQAMKDCGSREIVTQAQATEMKWLAKRFEDNATVVFNGLLRPGAFRYQTEVSFFYRGFLHKGKRDAEGTDRQDRFVIWDLKRMGGSSGERKVRWEIKQNLLDLQSAIYCHEYDEKGVNVIYYVMAISNEGYVTPFRISRDDRDRARVHWNKLIMGAHQCNMNEDLSAGPEFWADSEGFFDF